MSQPTPGTLLEREDHGNVTVLRLKVPALHADATTEALFDQANAVVLDGKRSQLVLNMDGVGYMASPAIGRLVVLMHKARQAGGKLVLCRLSRPLVELMRITHLADVLLSYDDEHQAVQSFPA